MPAAAVLPGWVKFEGDGIEIWLPETYVGGNIEENLDLIVERLRNLGPDFEQMARTIEQNPSMYSIWAIDSVIGDSGFLTNICAIREEVMSVVTIDMYLDATIKQLPAQFQVEKREIGTLGDYQAGYLILYTEINGQKIRELLYTVKSKNTMYVFTFATGASEFDQRSPEFEQIMQTFSIQP